MSPPGDLDHVRAETRERNDAFWCDDVRRLFHADAETLAEHGIRDFLGAIAPFLRREGVRVDVGYRRVKAPARGERPAGWAVATLNADGWLDEDGALPLVESMQLSLRTVGEMCEVSEDDLETSDTYLLHLGKREFVVYRLEPGMEGDEWRRATRSTIALLDELLAGHGSAERAYARMGGNDLHIAFVTPEMAQVINAACKPGEGLHDGSAP
ncbi:MAG: hypothetical protein WKG00_12940 [Polyangiaceae bacterium]